MKLNLRHPLLALLAMWLLYVAVLAVLTALKLDVGLKIWPLGEDRNWLSMLMGRSASATTHEFWKLDGRNALSPWWYIAAWPMIRSSIYGLQAVSMLMQPLMACSMFLALDQLGRGRSRLFAFSVASVVLVWMFTDFYSHIGWNFFGAASLTLLTIYCYCRYVDENRSNGLWLAAALLCYFVAIGTYTLQAGALLAVAAIGIFRGQEIAPRRRLTLAALEIAAFASLFVLFTLMWVTSTPAAVEALPWTDRSALHQAAASVQLAFAPALFPNHLRDTLDWSRPGAAAACAAGAAYLFLTLRRASKTLTTGPAPVGWAVVVLASLLAPTVILEATSSLWVPGTRTPMVQPLYYPLLALTVAAMLAFAAKRLVSPPAMLIGLVALVGGAALAVSLGQSHRLVLVTKYERILAKELAPLVPADARRIFVVKIVNPVGPWVAGEPITPFSAKNYGRTVFGREGVEILVLQRTGARCLATPIFDQTSARVLDEQYALGEVVNVMFDGRKVTAARTVDRDYFRGLCATWNRSEPIMQPWSPAP